LLGAVLLLTLPLPLAAQNFRAFTFLRTIETLHFEIIYPPESEPTAQSLAEFADPLYDRVTGLLGITLNRRIPVVITPHTDDFNGYMGLLPYPHIVLFDTPLNIDRFLFRNVLEGLFLHELTHAISLSAGSPFWNVLRTIFGGWVTMTALNAPKFMVEGAAVSFESLDGFGRAGDPLIREKLRQAIHEDAFLSPYQAMGVYDLSPGHDAYYDYGGLFSAYLQDRYGMEKYAELWQAMGRGYHFSLFFYNNGYFHLFKEVYGLPLVDAWAEFKDSLEIDGLEENAGGFIAGSKTGAVRGAGVLPGGKTLIRDTAAGGGRVFFLDQVSRKVYAYDPPSGSVRAVVNADNSAYALDVSADGERMLVSSFHYTGALAGAVVTEYDLRRGWKTGRTWKGLYGGRYFRDGVIGLSSTLHSNNLVFRTAGGQEELLLRGNAELLYADPCALDDRRLLLIAAERGERKLWLYEYETREARALESEAGDDDPRWRYVRGLRASQGRVLFSFDHDDRMYKLGAAELLGESGTVVFSQRDFSGGVFLPVLVDGEIYYRGAFAAGDALMKYPEGGGGITGTRSSLHPRPLGEGAGLSGAETPLPGTKPSVGTELELSGGEGALPRKSRGYFSLKYLNPLRLWLPIPLINSKSLSLDGAGIFSYMTDPMANNEIYLTAGMDFRNGLAPVDIQWTNMSLGFPVNVQFSDEMYTAGSPVYRETQGVLAARISHGLGSDRRRFFIHPGFGVSLYAPDPGNGDIPYTWEYDNPYYNMLFGLGVSTMVRYYWDLFGQGTSFAVYARYLLPRRTPRFEGILQTAFEPYLPVQLALYGAWDQSRMDIQGNSPYYSDALFSGFSSPEYAGGLRELLWLAGGEAEAKLFSVEAQGGVSHFYINRIFGTLAYRGVFYDDQGALSAAGNSLGGRFRLAQSLALRLGLTASSAILASQPVKFSLWFRGAWKISNLNNQKSDDFWFGPGFALEM
jgi:hypothetical protein